MTHNFIHYLSEMADFTVILIPDDQHPDSDSDSDSDICIVEEFSFHVRPTDMSDFQKKILTTKLPFTWECSVLILGQLSFHS